MKKLLMMFSFTCSITALYAQHGGNKKFKLTDNLSALLWGANNITTLTGNNPAIRYKPMVAFQIGIETELMRFSEYTGLNLGVAYSMQGGRYNSEGYSYNTGGNYGRATASATVRLNYLNFPLLMRYQKARDGFFMEGGLQPGVLLSAKDKSTGTINIKEEVKKFDMGVPVGVGYAFKNKISLGLRITPGLLNINKDEASKNRNLVTSLRVSYAL